MCQGVGWGWGWGRGESISIQLFLVVVPQSDFMTLKSSERLAALKLVDHTSQLPFTKTTHTFTHIHTKESG